MDLKQLQSDLEVFKGRIHQEIDTVFQVNEVLRKELQAKERFISILLGNLPERFFCPVCNSKLKYFNPLPLEYQENAEKHGYAHFGQGEMTAVDTYSCPQCGASDRERLYAYWLMTEGRNFLHSGSAIIHFAPEALLSQWIRQNGYTHYRTADLSMPNVDYYVDLTHLPFAENQYDFFICSHVLEHVPSDDHAIAELYRILKPGGKGILMAPICTNLEHTLEDPTVTSEADRWRLYGQGDHVRLYAHQDYVAKIRKHGFLLHELTCSSFGVDLYREMGLKETSILYIVEKPL